MSTINSMAEDFANYLLLNRSNPSAGLEIAHRIKKITYSDTGNRLTNDDKDKLIDAISNMTLDATKKRLPGGRFYSTEAQDSTQLIQLIQLIRTEVKK